MPFVSVLDMFIKMKKKFHMEHCSATVQMMAFFEYFVYKIDSSKDQLSNTTRIVGDKIFNT